MLQRKMTGVPFDPEETAVEGDNKKNGPDRETDQRSPVVGRPWPMLRQDGENGSVSQDDCDML